MKIINYLIIYSFIITTCAPPTPITYSFSKFGNKRYEKTNPEDIKVYKRTLDIDSQFVEIGVLIVNGTDKIHILDVKKEAAKYGATGIVKEGKNFVLIITIKKKNDIEKKKTKI